MLQGKIKMITLKPFFLTVFKMKKSGVIYMSELLIATSILKIGVKKS